MPLGKLAHRKAPFFGGYAAGATFTIGTETSNAITVSVQVTDGNRRDVDRRVALQWYLSDDANGDSVVATAPDGGVAAGTDGVVVQYVTGKAGLATTESDGDLDVVVTHAAGAKTCYLALVLPDGSLVVSGAVTFA